MRNQGKIQFHHSKNDHKYKSRFILRGKTFNNLCIYKKWIRTKPKNQKKNKIIFICALNIKHIFIPKRDRQGFQKLFAQPSKNKYQRIKKKKI